MVEKLRKITAVDGNTNPAMLNTNLSVVTHNGVGKSKVHAEIFHRGKCFTVLNIRVGMLRRLPKNQVSKQIHLAVVLLCITLLSKV